MSGRAAGSSRLRAAGHEAASPTRLTHTRVLCSDGYDLSTALVFKADRSKSSCSAAGCDAKQCGDYPAIALYECEYQVSSSLGDLGKDGMRLTQEGENTVAGGWWALIVVGVLLFALLAALCLFSGKIVRGDCGGWAQKHLTHGNKKIPVLYLAPTDKLDQMAAKASAEAPVSPSAVGADVD